MGIYCPFVFHMLSDLISYLNFITPNDSKLLYLECNFGRLNLNPLFVCVKFRWLGAQSMFYHLYNQVSYMSLDQISPLTFSVGNTMKRIFVIVSSIIIFHTPIRPVNAIGAAIAILGTFLYSQVHLSL